MPLSAVVAYTPFVDPVTEWSQGIMDAWVLTLPVLALLTSVAYKAVRHTGRGGYWRAVVVMAVQITVAIAGIGVAIGVLQELIVPALGG